MVLFFLTLLQAAPASPDIPVMSFNIRYGTAADSGNAWPGRRRPLVALIRRHGPDILGLQEALDFQLREVAGALSGYGRVGVGRDDGERRGEFSPILYRRSRFTLLASGTFWFSPTPDTPGSTGWGNVITRIATWARLRDQATGRTLYVYNLHLDHESAASRDSSALLLARRIRDREHPDPVLVLGDFNTGEHTFPVRFLVDSLRLSDTFREVTTDSAGVGTFHGFTGRANGERIDYILADSAWTVRSAGIDRSHRGGRYPSDHFPVHAVLRLRAR
jgi:endonuclease/exonuclease/phosphatase family metal-dependent hydrolase